MSNIANLTQQIISLGQQLTAAHERGDQDEVDNLTDLLNDLEDELEDAQADSEKQPRNWN